MSLVDKIALRLHTRERALMKLVYEVSKLQLIFKWLKMLLRLFKKDTTKLYDGCTLCYDSGVVRFTLRNKHFEAGDYYRQCPRGCGLTQWGRLKLTN